MKRPLKPEEVRLWTVVASTVRPAPGRTLPKSPAPDPELQTIPSKLKKWQTGPSPTAKPAVQASAPPLARFKPNTPQTPDSIEPLRKRRIARERDPIEARLDLHGLDQDRARLALHGFLQRAHAQGFRAVLVITGKGTLGDGVLRRRAPDWLSEPQVRPLIAGFSPAERHHGGEGALYIALKRKQPRRL
jgi:DNA-nicking Smr family endonuclease